MAGTLVILISTISIPAPSLAPNMYDLVAVAIATGCRKEKRLGAELDQVDGNQLHIWKTTTDEPRAIPLNDDTVAGLLGS
jgi:integrase